MIQTLLKMAAVRAAETSGGVLSFDHSLKSTVINKEDEVENYCPRYIMTNIEHK